MLTILFSIICLQAVEPASHLQAEVPAELRKMMTYRSNLFETAHIEWSAGDAQANCYYTSRYAGQDFLLVNHGTETGLHYIHYDGTPYAYSDEFLLRKDGQQWRYTEEFPRMSRIDDDAPAVYMTEQTDLRSAGFYPLPRMGSKPDRWNPERFLDDLLGKPNDGYQVTPTQDEMVEVSGRFGEGTMTWKLDPKQEYQPVIAEVTFPNNDGTLETEQALTTYQRIDGKVFPDRIDYVRNGKAYEHITVDNAVFDHPELPAELRVTDFFPLMQGVNIAHYDSADKRHLEIWDGQQARTTAEVTAMKEQGTFDNWPFILHQREIRANGVQPNSKPKPDADGCLAGGAGSRRPGLWENFTRRFIAVAKLDKAQTRRAWEHLAKCQSAAYKQLPDIRKQTDDMEKELVRLRTYGTTQLPRTSVPPRGAADDAASGTDVIAGGDDRVIQRSAPPMPPPAEDAKAAAERIQRLEDQLAGAYAPIDAILEHDLKPRLNDLLTPDQKKLIAIHDAEVRARAGEKK